MNNELLEALNLLEQEKNISKDTLLEAIENSLVTACKNHFGKSDNVKVDINRDTCEFVCYQEKTVVEEVLDPVEEISLIDAQMINGKYSVGDIVRVEVKSKEFGRIATQNAKNVILQKIREEERKVIFDEYNSKEKDVVTGVVQRYVGKNVSINLGKADALLTESEQIKGETFQPTERIKVYILEVKSTSKGPKILVSRTHPELVKRLFESEVTEVKEGIVEIKSISREAGSRTKIAVWSNDPDVDPVGACVGMNGARVNAIVNELRGEKIDIITWDENPAILIQNALSPAKVISVIADADEKTAKVVVPDYQLPLAIGKEGQNARLAARLTGFKIDIKSETQARESGDFYDYEEDYEDDNEYSPIMITQNNAPSNTILRSLNKSLDNISIVKYKKSNFYTSRNLITIKVKKNNSFEKIKEEFNDITKIYPYLSVRQKTDLSLKKLQLSRQKRNDDYFNSFVENDNDDDFIK